MNTESKENWKAIPGFPAYEVSNYGQVRSFWGGPPRRRFLADAPQRILSPLSDKKGYLYVGLYKNNKKHRFFIHQLVLLAFIGPCPEGHETCHNDGIKLNNQLSNLRWDIPANNYADVRKHGSKKGMKHPNSKFTDTRVIQIREMVAQGKTYKEVSRTLGINYNSIKYIASYRGWTHIG